MATRVAAGVEFTNTFLPDDYERFISTCDAIVILAQQAGYYRHHSANILDCVSLRTLVVRPTVPLFASEIGDPAQVGTTFGTLDSLPAAVLDAQRRAVELNANHSNYFAGRRLTTVTTALESGVSSSNPQNG